MPSPEMFGPASMVLSQGISSFTTFLPPLSEVRKASLDDPAIVGDVRLGEVAAAALTIGLAGIASSITGSPIPTYVAIVVSIGLIILYETALRSSHAMEPKKVITAEDVIDNA